MPKYFLVNTNARPVNVTHRGTSVALKPGVDHALCLGEMTPEQVLPYKALSQIGVLVRTGLGEQKASKAAPIAKDKVTDKSQSVPPAPIVPPVVPPAQLAPPGPDVPQVTVPPGDYNTETATQSPKGHKAKAGRS